MTSSADQKQDPRDFGDIPPSPSAPEQASDRGFDRAFQDFCRELHTSPALSTTPAIIATEFQRLFQLDRTWVLVAAGARVKLQAVGGIPGFQRRADVVRNLEELIRLIGREKQPFHWSAGEPTTIRSPKIRMALDRYLDEVHVSSLRVQPVFGPSPLQTMPGAAVSAPLMGAIVCEWFQPPRVNVDDSRWRAAAEQVGIALQNASDWSRAPFANFMRRWRRGITWRLLTGWGLALLLVSLLLGFAALIPIELTIDAMGELQPVRRRHVFAITAGIVRRLAVTSGSGVSEGTTLLELDSPELERDIRKTEGDLQTTEKRIASIEASRLNFDSNLNETASQLNALAGELQEQRQKRANLVTELEMYMRRRDELKVISPIAGRVMTWDVERMLSRRPISRGQRLMTISDTAGPWELELRVPDDDASDLFAAMKDNQSVSVEFIIVAAPDRMHSTTLKSVSETIEIRSPGAPPSLLCLADVPEYLTESAVEGISVRGRIHCGRRPAILVVFHKFWRNVREQIFFPWGW